MRLVRVTLIAFIAVVALTSLGGCVAPLPDPDVVIAPEPRLDNEGQYMCPFTQDGTVALWVDKGINAKTGAAIGRTAGAVVGQQVLGRVPLIGGLLGSAVGGAIGRGAAISSCGGWEYIKETSDVSFDSFDNMAVYLYATYAKHEHFSDATQAAFGIYPKLQSEWHGAILRAPRREVAQEGGRQ